MKKQELNWMWIIGIILIGILLWQYNQPFSTLDMSSVPTINQYTGFPSNIGCLRKVGIFMNEATINKESSIYTGIDNYTFKTSEIVNGTNCKLKIDVYKNGVFLDSKILNSEQIYNYNYCDSLDNCIIIKDAMIYKPDGLCGDSQKINYNFHISEKSFPIKIYSDKDSYNPKDNITFFVNVENKLNMNITGKLKLIYGVKSIIGNVDKIIEKDINIPANSNNTFNFIIPTTNETGTILVSTTLSTWVKGFIFSNLNYGTVYKQYCYDSCQDGSYTCEFGDKPQKIFDSNTFDSGIIISESYTLFIGVKSCSSQGLCTNINGDCIPCSNETICFSQGKCANANGTCITCPTAVNCSDWGLCTDTNGDCITCGGYANKTIVINNTVVNNTQICNAYFYTDNNNKDCSSKSFCGTFMYQGLRIFTSKEDCESSLPKTNWILIGLISMVIGLIIYIIWRRR